MGGHSFVGVRVCLCVLIATSVVQRELLSMCVIVFVSLSADFRLPAVPRGLKKESVST